MTDNKGIAFRGANDTRLYVDRTAAHLHAACANGIFPAFLTIWINRMRIEGTIKTWNDERGFGFIEPAQGGQEIFLHIKALVSRDRRPEIGQPVRFDIETTPDGKKRATRVEIVQPKRQRNRARHDTPAQWGTASLFAIPAFLLVFSLAAILWKVPGWVAMLYLAASLVCFAAYAKDKAAAAANAWRVSESTLLMLGLLGGWPGAIVAQQVLRHKSNKAAFRASFWLTVLANVAGFIVLSSPIRTLLPV